jgi:hypothetical protein
VLRARHLSGHRIRRRHCLSAARIKPEEVETGRGDQGHAAPAFRQEKPAAPTRAPGAPQSSLKLRVRPNRVPRNGNSGSQGGSRCKARPPGTARGRPSRVPRSPLPRSPKRRESLRRAGERRRPKERAGQRAQPTKRGGRLRIASGCRTALVSLEPSLWRTAFDRNRSGVPTLEHSSPQRGQDGSGFAFECVTRSASATRRSANSTGFVMWALKPASSA